jgi:hypothetical protein
LLDKLDALFAGSDAELESWRTRAFANAHLALAMLNDQAGNWKVARNHLIQAIKVNPRLLVSYPTVRRLVKLLAGKRLVGALRARPAA